MGWERRGAKLYYYSKRRHGRRVVSTYVGTGVAGASEALAAAGRRAEREAERAACRALSERQQEIDRASESWSAVVELGAQAVLVAAGYRRRGRGPWRKARDYHEA
jgi:hypothetical protein